MIAPVSAKEILDWITEVATVTGIIGGIFAYLFSRRETKQKGERAIQQIDILATNHFPHMQADLSDLNKKTDTTNTILTELRMGQVETNTLLRSTKTTITIDKSGT